MVAVRRPEHPGEARAAQADAQVLEDSQVASVVFADFLEASAVSTVVLQGVIAVAQPEVVVQPVGDSAIAVPAVGVVVSSIYFLSR